MHSKWNQDAVTHAVVTNHKSIKADSSTMKLLPHSNIALVTVLLYACNWCNMYCMSRTLGNSMETSLLLIIVWLLEYGDTTCWHSCDCQANSSRFTRRPLAFIASMCCNDEYYRISMIIASSSLIAISIYTRLVAAILLAPIWLHYAARYKCCKEFICYVSMIICLYVDVPLGYFLLIRNIYYDTICLRYMLSYVEFLGWIFYCTVMFLFGLFLLYAAR